MRNASVYTRIPYTVLRFRSDVRSFQKIFVLKNFVGPIRAGSSQLLQDLLTLPISQSRPRKEKDENLGKGTTKEIFKVRNFFCNVLQL